MESDDEKRLPAEAERKAGIVVVAAYGRVPVVMSPIEFVQTLELRPQRLFPLPLIRDRAPREAGDSANYGGYSSDEVDQLIDEARTTESREARLEVWAEVERVALRDQVLEGG